MSKSDSGSATPRAHAREAILVVDDDAGILGVVVSMLERLGYRVETAASGDEAIERLCSAAARPQLVLSDVVMPGMSGVELFDRIAVVSPDVKVLFMSGNPHREGAPALPAPFVRKPFTADELGHAVRAVIDGGRDAGASGPA